MRTFAQAIRTSAVSAVQPAAPTRAPTRNPAVRTILQAPLQPKLKIGALDNADEAKANRIDDRMMHVPKPISSLACPRLIARGLQAIVRDSSFEMLRLCPDNVAHLVDKYTSKPVPNPFARSCSKAEAQVVEGKIGELVAQAHKAEAVTIGTRIFAPAGRLKGKVMSHELVHAAQALIKGSPAPRKSLEAEAEMAVSAVHYPMAAPLIHLSPSGGQPLRHPALRTLIRAGIWLSKRTTNTLSKHIARHGRRIVGRRSHTIFKKPKEIRSLVKSAVEDSVRLARAQATRGADEALEESALRVFRQKGPAPGKFRTVIEKDFGKTIGTRGERILHVVIDQSGRVVTCYPKDRLIAVGLGAVATELFTTKTAEAAEETRVLIETEENRSQDFGEIAFDVVLDIASFGLLSPTPLNEGEDLMLALDRIVENAAWGTIREIEEAEGICLTEKQIKAIHDLAKLAIGTAMELEDFDEAQ